MRFVKYVAPLLTGVECGDMLCHAVIFEHVKQGRFASIV